MVDQQRGEVGGDLVLGSPREAHLDDLVEALVGSRAGSSEALELVGVLDRAQHRQCPGHRDVPRAGERILKAEELEGPGGVGDRVRPIPVEQRRERRERVVCPVGPVDQLDRPGARRALRVGTFQRRA